MVRFPDHLTAPPLLPALGAEASTRSPGLQASGLASQLANPNLRITLLAPSGEAYLPGGCCTCHSSPLRKVPGAAAAAAGTPHPDPLDLANPLPLLADAGWQRYFQDCRTGVPDYWNAAKFCSLEQLLDPANRTKLQQVCGAGGVAAGSCLRVRQ